MEIEAMSIRITEHRMDGNWIRELGCGITLAEAIRASGLSCETCEHYHRHHPDRLTGVCFRLNSHSGHSCLTDFFCAHHTLLTQPSEGKE